MMMSGRLKSFAGLDMTGKKSLVLGYAGIKGTVLSASSSLPVDFSCWFVCFIFMYWCSKLQNKGDFSNMAGLWVTRHMLVD